ncbi:MAG: hypothetical protein JO347_05335, partial [Candidatus Eremiobacteraeota bacterium]|nr:hypothetical protein [Candidatus Eremiobacteraeota bacterium]
MNSAPGVVAHMIVGRRPESYLADALASLAGVCDHAVINDNSGAQGGPNDTVIGQSEFARSGRLTHLRTTFVDFSAARNACIAATPAAFDNGWALFADADEVHGEELGHMAALLPRLPAGVDSLDGYTRNFVGSFDYWNTLHRRLRFFRLAHDRRWEGDVHERLAPLRRREVVPAVGSHYGHVCTLADEVDRERLYKSLGQPETLLDRAALDNLTPAIVWGNWLRDAVAFTGDHPLAVRGTIARLRAQWAETFAQVQQIVASQTILDRLRNAVRASNYQ